MKSTRGLALLFALLFAACQPSTPKTVTIIDGEQIITLQTDERVPAAILAQTGITLTPNDHILVNGATVSSELPITTYPITIQIRRAVTVTIVSPQGEEQIQTSAFTVGEALQETGIQIHAGDQIDPPINSPIASLQSPITIYHLPSHNLITIQIRRAVTVTIVSPQGEEQIQTSAFTVGEALQEAGIQIHAGDQIDPPINSPIASLQSPITIYHLPSHNLTITVDGTVVQTQSSARTVGEALAEAGIPLLGLDQAIPSENEALPSDGNIKVVRVTESVVLAQKPIPFETETIASAEIALDQTQILSPGENGLSVQRIRIRYEDGAEVSRVTEDETLVRPPKNRTLAYGTKVEIKTATVNGVQIEYWRAVQMYATSYSPCNLGTNTCGSTTASGKQLQKGMVALRTDLYRALKGQPLFIPGYGYATVEDACGGCVGRPWIDLGFTDANYEPWHEVVTVYFLTPVPSYIPPLE